ncbi:MAG: hypothetical protein QXY87_01660 [Saccharolobus sp.]|uniref:Uncharacterized protein n=1 Tax=Saccharolobus shibatae (strain ATCC 51178 / DSM 5389 / JCM 8931 / NBRC 15437 / B12) TaxID=523848 RepID=A0A8F5BKX3_SACSH|nr:hypothetical protein [Saccharolobus shibatae]MCH4814375.1 hypothetical protein [Saccharolobus shibatae]QXJ27215.1 hypothetical protein J5U23_00073 [Saccharolobus shibatae B12]
MDEMKDLTLKVLKKIDNTIVDSSLQIKYYQGFKDRYDVFGEYENQIGIYEFAISFDKKGNLKRSHINMISPKNIRKDLEKKIYKE